MAGEKSKTLAQLIDLLEPLSDEERLRAVNAALTFLGTSILSTAPTRKASKDSDDENEREDHGLPASAIRWLKQNQILESQLENIFHFGSNEVQIIASDVAGKGNKEKAKQCYLLVGVRTLLQDGEPKVSDEEARQVCRRIGCYDRKNHSRAVRDLGNFVTGSQSAGFVLTQPGLRAIAETIKTMNA